MRSLVATLILTSSSLMLGCGLRGPLYLPEEKAGTEAEAAQPAAPAEEGKIVSPQPAPQAQKRDRPANTTDPQSQAPAN
jgi:predicted small lipoprotein YifL